MEYTYLNWDDEHFYATNTQESSITLSDDKNDVDNVFDLLDYLNTHKDDKHYVWIVTEDDPYGRRVETEYALFKNGEDAYKMACENQLKVSYKDEPTDIDFGYEYRTVLQYAKYASSLDDLLDFINKKSIDDDREEEQFDYKYGKY